MVQITRSLTVIGNSPGSSPTGTWLCRTTDGGDSWQVVSTLDYSSIQGWYSHDVAINPNDPTEIWAAGQPFSALVSTDGGPNLQFAENVGLMQPATGIESLEYPDLNNWADYHEIVYHPSNPEIIYFSYQNLFIFKYTNRGSLGSLQGSNVAPPGRRSTNFISPFVLSPVDNRTLYAGSILVHKSTNEGRTWSNTNSGQTLDGNPALSMAASHQDVNVVYVGTAPVFRRSHIFRTDNGGSLPDRFPTDLTVDPNDDRKVYLALGGFGSSHLFKSTNGGDTWIDAGAGLPDVPAWAVIVDPDFPEHIYVGNDLGVYFSPDAVIAMDLTISQANRSLRVATHGNGVYERKLIGDTSTDVAENFQPSDFRLEQNFPNPFNPTTTIRFNLKRAQYVTLQVFDVLGREIATLVDGVQTEGTHNIAFDAAAFGSSSVYIYRLTAGAFTQTRK
ncbi:MAG: T9SS type A sorting domain-containing protein, partial [bacterium]